MDMMAGWMGQNLYLSVMSRFLPLVLIVFSCFQACDSANRQAPFYTQQLPEDSPRFSKTYDSTKIRTYYPFVLYKDGSHMIAAQIESKELLDKYNPVFTKYGLSGNGYSWEGVIRQLLQKESPGFESHLLFDPEAGAFYVVADSEKSQLHFAKVVSKTFGDVKKLEEFLKGVDKGKVHD